MNVLCHSIAHVVQQKPRFDIRRNVSGDRLEHSISIYIIKKAKTTASYSTNQQRARPNFDRPDQKFDGFFITYKYEYIYSK